MNRYAFIIALAAVVTGLDQWTKWLVDANVYPFWPVEVTGFLNLVNVRNFGAAFGFLSDPNTKWQLWFFIGATLLAILIILGVARNAKSGDGVLFLALGLIMGGAVGNCIDRVRLGAVVDFLDFHVAGMHWPAFNVADIAICCGAALIVCLLLFGGKGKKKAKR